MENQILGVLLKPIAKCADSDVVTAGQLRAVAALCVLFMLNGPEAVLPKPQAPAESSKQPVKSEPLREPVKTQEPVKPAATAVASASVPLSEVPPPPPA